MCVCVLFFYQFMNIYLYFFFFLNGRGLIVPVACNAEESYLAPRHTPEICQFCGYG